MGCIEENEIEMEKMCLWNEDKYKIYAYERQQDILDPSQHYDVGYFIKICDS